MLSSQTGSDTLLGRYIPQVVANLGSGIVAGFLGARIHSAEDTVWFAPTVELPPPKEWLSLLKQIREGGRLCQLCVTP